MAATDFLMSLAGPQFEKARARLTALVGQFFTYRDRLLKMRDRADYMARKAEKTGNPALTEAIRQLTPRIDAAYNKQVALEGTVQGALSQIAAVQAGQGSAGLGATAAPASLFATATLLVKTAAAIALHQKNVAALESVLRQVESKSLTAAEAAQLRAGGMGASVGTIAAVAVGAVALVFFTMKARKR